MQSGPITRDLYIRPPNECRSNRRVLWKLRKLPYGIGEAGRQWAKTLEGWLTNEAQFHRVNGVSQLHVRRDGNGKIQLLLAKLTDDLLMAGSGIEVRRFRSQIENRFRISRATIDEEIRFNGCVISQSKAGDLARSMREYADNIKPILLSKARRSMKRAPAGKNEIASYRTMAGELVWLGCGALPQASQIASYMQQKIPYLTIEDLLSANKTLRE